MKRSPRPSMSSPLVPSMGLTLAAALTTLGCSSTDLETDDTPEGAPEVVETPETSGAEAEVAPEELPQREFPYEMVEGEPMFTVVPKDGIPAIDEPVFVTAAEAAAFMSDEETVLGVVGQDGTAKCYSAWQLDSHEIVNDHLDGLPIAATW